MPEKQECEQHQPPPVNREHTREVGWENITSTSVSGILCMIRCSCLRQCVHKSVICMYMVQLSMHTHTGVPPFVYGCARQADQMPRCSL